MTQKKLFELFLITRNEHKHGYLIEFNSNYPPKKVKTKQFPFCSVKKAIKTEVFSRFMMETDLLKCKTIENLNLDQTSNKNHRLQCRGLKCIKNKE